MTATRTLPALLVVTGLLTSGFATLHALHAARAGDEGRTRAQVDLAAQIATDRLRSAVLRDRPDLAADVLDEVLSPAPASAAYVIGLDGSVLASWSRGVAPEPVDAGGGDSPERPGDPSCVPPSRRVPPPR